MFWDSSAIVPLLVAEISSEGLLDLLKEAGTLSLWWASPVECTSALYRRHRDKSFPSQVLRQALSRLDALVEDATMIVPTDPVRRRTRRILATHPLRAADALQLAAALAWCDDDPRDAGFVCLDERLREAALREGFRVFPE